MHFYSIEWLEDGQVNVERDDGTTLKGTPTEILRPLLQPRRRMSGATNMSVPHQAAAPQRG